MHSKLPPSSASRRVICPGSRKLESLYPREETEATQEGTLAHRVCADLLLGRLIDEVPDEMFQHCKMYCDYIKGLNNQSAPLHIEERMDIPNIHPECWGTPDAWFVANNTLHMFDFKYGFGSVDVFENWQMVEYAAGVTEPFDLAVFHIIQPRDYHSREPIKTWNVERPILEAMWERLKRVEELAMDEDSYLSPSDQCVNCKARHACPSLQKTTLNHLDNLELSTPVDLNNEELGNELRILHRAAKLLDARITGLEEETLAKLKVGSRVPHYELGEVQSRERWAVHEKEILGMSELYGIDIRKPVDFITPKQAIAAGIPATIVRKYSETPKGAVKLVAIDPKKIKKIFS